MVVPRPPKGKNNFPSPIIIGRGCLKKKLMPSFLEGNLLS